MKRNFRELDEDEVINLKEDNYSRATNYGLSTVKNSFNQYLKFKNINFEQMNRPEIDQTLQNYWPAIRTIKNEQYSASSMLNHRQVLCIHIKKEKNIDIIYDLDFTDSNKVFKNYLKILKKNGKG